MENVTIQELNNMPLKELEDFLENNHLKVVVEKGKITSIVDANEK